MEALDEEVDQRVRACSVRIAELPGQHIAIQALWDGDTEGWFIEIGLVTAKRSAFPWGDVRSSLTPSRVCAMEEISAS